MGCGSSQQSSVQLAHTITAHQSIRQQIVAPHTKVLTQELNAFQPLSLTVDHEIPPIPPPTNYKNITSTDSTKKQMLITEEMVYDFEAIGVVINAHERNNIIAIHEDKNRQLHEIQAEIIALKQRYKELKTKSKEEHAEVDDIKKLKSMVKFFSNQEQYDRKLSEQEETYIQSKTELEDCENQLKLLSQQSSRLDAETTELKQNVDDLLQLYAKQDEILELAFGGVYGSNEEDQLEDTLDKLVRKNQRIRLTMQLWSIAKNLTETAQQQIEFACKRWMDIAFIPAKASYQLLKVQTISEARNYLITASRNLSSSHRYFHPVVPPYCDSNEVGILNKAITYIFIDGFSRERHAHAYNVYRTTAARSRLLAKWANSVITGKIKSDLEASNLETNTCRKALRKERIRLMSNQVKELTGKVLTLTEHPEKQAKFEETAIVKLSDTAEVQKVERSEQLEKQLQQAKTEVVGETNTELSQATQLTLEELAPAPTSNQIFGDLDSIMVEYERQQQEIQQHNKTEKARQEADLMEKVRRRRSRKMRAMQP
nr:uncharacterized protein LOC100185194 isoform X2 [Ciona intestinalis]|eukprot:XP_026695859.1 uncharacterized protein LOC100185194 isoform X2 [Ciona intestinalis]